MFKSINGGRLPERATRYSAGFDVFANEDVIIGAGETKLVGLGIALDTLGLELLAHSIHCDSKGIDYERFAMSHYFALHIRSSLRAKGLTSLGTGIIDMDYRDEIKMVISNPISGHKIRPSDGSFAYYTASANNISSQCYLIRRGDKIGQLILCRHEGWLLPSEYTKDEERNGGFGSTGNE